MIESKFSDHNCKMVVGRSLIFLASVGHGRSMRSAAARRADIGPAVHLSPRKRHPLLEENDLKNDRPKNFFFWTFAPYMTQIPPKKYNFTQFAAFFHFLFIEINYYFV